MCARVRVCRASVRSSVQSSCSNGGNRTTGLSWGEQWVPVAWCPTSNSPLMGSTAWGWAEPPWTCCTPRWATQVGPGSSRLLSNLFICCHVYLFSLSDSLFSFSSPQRLPGSSGGSGPPSPARSSTSSRLCLQKPDTLISSCGRRWRWKSTCPSPEFRYSTLLHGPFKKLGYFTFQLRYFESVSLS